MVAHNKQLLDYWDWTPTLELNPNTGSKLQVDAILGNFIISVFVQN